MVEYRTNVPLEIADVARVFNTSGIKRPTGDLQRLATMFANANLVISAWDDENLIGVCRALTDFSYCCYLSDLAVDGKFQKQGIGTKMVELVRAAIGDKVSLILLSAHDAMEYYPKIGFERIDNGYIIKRLQ